MEYLLTSDNKATYVSDPCSISGAFPVRFPATEIYCGAASAKVFSSFSGDSRALLL